MSEARDARFDAFLGATSAEERNWIAFCQFERAIDEILECAAIVNPLDEPDLNERERQGMKVAVWEMVFRVLPRVGLGSIVSSIEGLGYGIRFAVIQPKPNALDHIADAEDFDELLAKGYDAYAADHRRRLDEAMERRIATELRKRSDR